MLLQATLAFLAFGLCASSVYLLNYLLDLPVDRAHPTKRHRAFATGTLPIRHGLALIPILLAAALALTLLLPVSFLGSLALYYRLTCAYSLRLKRMVLVDVLTFTVFYTLQVIAGAAATGVVLSFWLLTFSMFLFLSLALVKRYAELLLMQQEQQDETAGCGYRLADLETLSQFGITSGYLAVLVLVLYINGDTVGTQYRHPEVIWLLCPLFLYWISFVWLLTRRGRMHEDPVLFAIENRRSHWLFALMALIVCRRGSGSGYPATYLCQSSTVRPSDFSTPPSTGVTRPGSGKKPCTTSPFSTRRTASATGTASTGPRGFFSTNAWYRRPRAERRSMKSWSVPPGPAPALSWRY